MIDGITTFPGMMGRKTVGGGPVLTGDTYVRGGSLDLENYNGQSLVLKESNNTFTHRNIILSFSGVTSSSYDLRLVSSSDFAPLVSTTFDVDAYPDLIDQTTATWNSVSALPWTNIGSGYTVVCDAIGSVKTFPINGIVNNGGDMSLRLRATSNTDVTGARGFYSLENAPTLDDAPRLIYPVLPPEDGVKRSNLFSGYTSGIQTVSASGFSFGGAEPWRAFNSNTNSPWISGGSDQWLKIDLGSPQTIYSYGLIAQHSYTGFTIESSEDNISWTIREFVTDTDFPDNSYFTRSLNTPATARYWRSRRPGSGGHKLDDVRLFS